MLRDFLRSAVPGYEELDILLLLRRESGRTFSPAEAGERLALSPDEAFVALQRLRTHGMLTSRARRGIVRFRFAPRTDELKRHVARLARFYDVDRAAVVEIMSANSLDRVRAAAAHTFATVFGVRSKKRRPE